MRTLTLFLVTAAVLAVVDPAAAQRRPRKDISSMRAPEKPQILLREAFMAFREGEMREAKNLLERNLNAHPKHWPSMALLAKVLYALEQKSEARGVLRRALSTYPDIKPLNLLAAQLLMKENKPLKALEYYQRAQRGQTPDEGLPGDEAMDNEQLIAQIKQSISGLKREKPVFYSLETQEEPTNAAAYPNVTADRRLKIAVFAFRAAADSSPNPVISEGLTTSFVRSNCFLVIERQQLDKVLTEQDFQMTDAVDATTATSVGMVMGVDAVVVGSVGQGGATPEIDARIVDVSTGHIKAAASTLYRTRADLEQLVLTLSKSIYQ